MKLGTWEPFARSALRIVAGFTFSLHGLQKFLGFFGGMGGHGATAPVFSLLWTAGGMETFGGLLLILGLFSFSVGERDGIRIFPRAPATRDMADLYCRAMPVEFG